MKVKQDTGLVTIGALNAAFLDAGWGRGWPGPTNTGYRNAPGYTGSLATHPPEEPIISGRTYTFTQFEGAEVGTVFLAENDCTFYGCLFKDTSVDGGLVKIYGNRHTFNFCSFEPNIDFVAGVPVPHEDSYQYGITCDGAFNTFASSLTVMNCDFWGFGNCIAAAGSTESTPNRFYHNWIHDAADPGPPGPGEYHTDGIGNIAAFVGESHVEIVHNTILSPGNTNGLAFQSPGPFPNFLVKQNLLGGFGYTVAIWSDPSGAGVSSDVRFVDNVYTTELEPNFGPLYAVGGSDVQFWEAPGSVWKRNRLYVHPDGWGDPADSGKFWIPEGGLDLSERDYDSSLITSDFDYAGA